MRATVCTDGVAAPGGRQDWQVRPPAAIAEARDPPRLFPLPPSPPAPPAGAAPRGVPPRGAGGPGRARHYGLPSLIASLGCDADTPGFQAAMEKMGTGMFSLLTGPDTVSGIGGLDTDNTMSLEQLVLDAEIVGYIQRVMQPVPVREDAIHLDMLKRVGPAGNYLKERHTLLHFKEALWSSKLLLREGFVEGHPNEERVRTRARARVRELLAEHEVAPLDADVHQRIWEIARPGC